MQRDFLPTIRVTVGAGGSSSVDAWSASAVQGALACLARAMGPAAAARRRLAARRRRSGTTGSACRLPITSC